MHTPVERRVERSSNTGILSGVLLVESSGSGGQRVVVNMDERAWLPRHCRGDVAAFPTMLNAYRRPVYSYLARAGVADADRDDLFQTIFLKIHTGAASYQPSLPLAPWIFTIVANTVRNHIRDRRIPRQNVSLDDMQELTDPTPGPDRNVEARETVTWLTGALQDLPYDQQEVLLLATVAGLPLQEIADVLETPLSTIKTRLRRARLALAKGLARREQPAPAAGESHD